MQLRVQLGDQPCSRCPTCSRCITTPAPGNPAGRHLCSRERPGGGSSLPAAEHRGNPKGQHSWLMLVCLAAMDCCRSILVCAGKACTAPYALSSSQFTPGGRYVQVLATRPTSLRPVPVKAVMTAGVCCREGALLGPVHGVGTFPAPQCPGPGPGQGHPVRAPQPHGVASKRSGRLRQPLSPSALAADTAPWQRATAPCRPTCSNRMPLCCREETGVMAGASAVETYAEARQSRFLLWPVPQHS